MTTELIIAAIGTIAVPVAGWIFRIEKAIYNNENAISTASTKSDNLKELINEKFDAQEKALGAFDVNIDRRLSRIETALNGYLKETPHV